MSKSVAHPLILFTLFLSALLPGGCSSGKVLTDSETLERIVDRTDRAVLAVDLRDTVDYESGHIPGFLGISLDDGGKRLRKWIAPFDRDTTVLLICYGGKRSARAARMLRLMGFTDVIDYSPGYSGYLAEKGDNFFPEIGGCGCP